MKEGTDVLYVALTLFDNQCVSLIEKLPHLRNVYLQFFKQHYSPIVCYKQEILQNYLSFTFCMKTQFCTQKPFLLNDHVM